VTDPNGIRIPTDPDGASGFAIFQSTVAGVHCLDASTPTAAIRAGAQRWAEPTDLPTVPGLSRIPRR